MARGSSLYGKYRAAGTAAGKYQGSWYAQEGLEAKKGAESGITKMRLDTLDQNVGAVSEALSLASSMYEGHKSKQEMGRMAKPVEEGGLGAVEQKQSSLDWLFGAEKEYKLAGEGEKIYKASDVRAKFKSTLYDQVTDPTKTKVPNPKNKQETDDALIADVNKEHKEALKKGEQSGNIAILGDDKNKQRQERLETYGIQTNTGTLADDVGLSNEADLDLTATSNILGKDYADQGGQGALDEKEDALGIKANPYTGIEFGEAYGLAKKSQKGEGTFWYEGAAGTKREGINEYAF